MTNESKNQLIDRLILSIRTENIDAFNENTQKGIIWFGEEGLQKILNEELPLYLDAYGNASDMKTLLKYMVDCDEKTYVDLITSLLAEIIKVLQKEGYEFGKDFSYKVVKDLPTLCIKTFMKIKSYHFIRKLHGNNALLILFLWRKS